jgi:hypothetical protein
MTEGEVVKLLGVDVHEVYVKLVVVGGGMKIVVLDVLGIGVVVVNANGLKETDFTEKSDPEFQLEYGLGPPWVDC